MDKKLEELIRLIDDRTDVTSIGKTAEINSVSFLGNVYTHCSCINFSSDYNLIDLSFISDNFVAGYRHKYFIKSPGIELIRAIWDKSIKSRKAAIGFMLSNKPHSTDDSQMIWAMSKILGGRDED